MLRFRTRPALLLSAGLLLAFSSLDAAPRDEHPLRAAPAGALIAAPSGDGKAELLELDPRLAATLLSVEPESTVRVDSWPIAPGLRRTVYLKRREIYAPDARIVSVENGREVEVPR